MKQNKQRRRVPADKRANPPQIPTEVVITRTYRFRSTDATLTTILKQDLLGIAGAVCTVANTTVSFIARACKVHRVEIWAPPASQGAASTCAIRWKTPEAQNMTEISDSSVSTAFPAHVRGKPPVGSYLSFWISSDADSVMDLTAPVGAIIDVHCTHVLMDTGAAGTTYAVAAGTLGGLYYLPLDGAGDLYLPVSLTTTT